MALLLAAPAFACTPAADFTADPGSAAAGEAVRITGRAFDANSGMPVKIKWAEPGSSSSKVLLSVPVDENGSFKATVTVPTDARPGYYDLHAAQTGGKVARLAAGRFEVVPAGQRQAQPEPQQQPQPQPQPQPQQQAQPQPQAQQSETAPAPRSDAAPAAASTAPASAPSAAPAASKAPASATAPAPATPAPASEVATPAASAEPAPVIVDEGAAASPSAKTATSDLWSGFSDGAAEGPSLNAPAHPVSPAGSLGGGIALLVIGSLMLLAGIGVAGTRRIRAKATA